MQYYGVKDFYHNVASDKRYWLPCTFFMILSYGFSAFNRTVSIDDLARSYYVGEGNAMIAGMRWFMGLYTRLFSSIQFAPFHDKFLGLAFMFIALKMVGASYHWRRTSKPHFEAQGLIHACSSRIR